jgi:hypothetical protein
VTDDLEGLGYALKVLRYVFAELAKLVAAVRTTDGPG